MQAPQLPATSAQSTPFSRTTTRFLLKALTHVSTPPINPPQKAHLKRAVQLLHKVPGPQHHNGATHQVQVGDLCGWAGGWVGVVCNSWCSRRRRAAFDLLLACRTAALCATRKKATLALVSKEGSAYRPQPPVQPTPPPPGPPIHPHLVPKCRLSRQRDLRPACHPAAQPLPLRAAHPASPCAQRQARRTGGPQR